ncbi:MAG: 3-hydroxyacyl-CoA dehydrogenase NAD-binding domain-containing protein, partial [Nocardioidaceae bacterium]
AEIFATAEEIKAQLRRLETIGKPVVAAINGAALGGGLEITLACHHRIAVDDRYDLGLPEVSLGLLPGGGGVTRTVRMLGLSDALMGLLLTGTKLKPAQAKEKGLLDELVSSRDELVPAAKAWILAHQDAAEAATQPWDRPGYRMPGGTPSSPKLAAFLPAFPANLRKQVKGADYPAPKAILSAAVEGAQVDFDTASRIESRYLTNLIVGQNSKNMIQAFFFDLQAINSGALRPEGVPKFQATKLGVLGAGMMGAGIAYSAARSGIEVVLKDVSAESAEKGKGYSVKLLDKAVDRGKMTRDKADEVLARITPIGDPSDLAGCDLVIEAVFEDPSLKNKVFGEILDVVDSDALLCSNTSTLPITELAEAVGPRAESFIGLHFFSPVDKMPLVEIIKGAKTSDETVARAVDVVQQIKKTPIVVNDSRGFYTSRVIGTQINEGLAMLGEGVRPMSIERAALQAGYPVGPLQISDELNMELMVKIRNATRAAVEREGRPYVPHPSEAVIDKMIEVGRPSKLKGAGFYEYDESGKRLGLWKGLADTFPVADEQADLAELEDRFLFIEALETAKCFAEGVIESAAAANIGSIMGIGYPPNTGGAVQFMQGYEGGLSGFVARARELAAKFGERFEPPAILVEKAEKGEKF